RAKWRGHPWRGRRRAPAAARSRSLRGDQGCRTAWEVNRKSPVNDREGVAGTIRAMSDHATQVYALGAGEEETARLRRQSEELRPEAEALLSRIGLRPGQAAVDLGCGPSGILGLLATAVSPSGKVVGVDADAAHGGAAGRFAPGPGNGSGPLR